MRKSIVLLLAMILIGCYPVSHIVVGETKSPISPLQVKILAEYPDGYEIIARRDASSEFAFKDPSINITWQRKSDKIIERLKMEASNLGANSIVIKNTENKNKNHISYDDEEGESTVTYTHYKVVTATAIFIK